MKSMQADSIRTGHIAVLWRINTALIYTLILTVSSLTGAGSAHAESLPGPLVDVGWLDGNLDKVTLLDVRADVNSFSKRSKGGSPVNPCGAGVKGKDAEAVAGHIPGAVLVRWSLLTAQQTVAGQKTDGWLPPGDDFERLMQKSGVNKEQPVVITYKGEKAIETAMAARLYYTLKYFGHNQIAILDGGTAAWIQSDRKVKFGRSKSARGNFAAGPGRTELVAVLSEVRDTSESGNGQLLDVREPAGFLGVARNITSVDPMWHGHIPGSINVPMTLLSNNVGPAAVLFDSDTLRQSLSLMGAVADTPTTVLWRATTRPRCSTKDSCQYSTPAGYATPIGTTSTSSPDAAAKTPALKGRTSSPRNVVPSGNTVTVCPAVSARRI